MDIKLEIKQEASVTDSCLENEREGLTKEPIKKVKSETVTSNSDCDTRTEIQQVDVSSKFSEHNVMRCNDTIEESEIETIYIKQEHVWLETDPLETPYITGDIKDGADEDFYSRKSPTSYQESVSSYTSDIFYGEDLRNDISFKDSPECKSDRKCESQESVVTGISSVDSNAYSEVPDVSMAFCFQQSNKTSVQLPNSKKNKLNHENTGPHKCDLCNKTFTVFSNLNRHKMIHEGKQPHKCDICDKGFSQLSNLKTHKLIHDGIKPHKCNICDKAFTQLSSLQKHKLTHEGIMPYKCNICNKPFTQVSNLKTHQLIHEGIRPHKCNICNNAFTDSSNLRRHKLIHEGIKPYKCDMCEKAFTELSNLKIHKLIHEGIKPHKCNICNKAFTHLLTLRRHRVTHKDKQPQ